MALKTYQDVVNFVAGNTLADWSGDDNDIGMYDKPFSEIKRLMLLDSDDMETDIEEYDNICFGITEAHQINGETSAEVLQEMAEWIVKLCNELEIKIPEGEF